MTMLDEPTHHTALIPNDTSFVYYRHPSLICTLHTGSLKIALVKVNQFMFFVDFLEL